MDAYAAFQYVRQEGARVHGIDPERIGIAGESGGAYVCTGLAMELALRGEGGQCRLHVPISPLTGDSWTRF